MLILNRKSMPHHSTYRRIETEVVDPEKLEQILSSVLIGKKFVEKQALLSIDGKVLRGTLVEAQDGTFLFAAYLPSEGLVLMEVELEGKGCEIPRAAKLLNMVDLREKVVMGDAMHTQRAVSIQIVESGGDYIWFAKGNPPQLKGDIRLWFEPEPDPIPGQGRPPKDFETVKEISKGHGRLEEQTISSQLNDFLEWPFLQQVFQLQRTTTFLKTGKTCQEIVYGITSLSAEQASPLKLLSLLRSYWRIENSLHYPRDVSLQEDFTRFKSHTAAHCMAIINNLVLAILTQTDLPFVPSARRFFAAHPDKALEVLL